MSFETVQQAVAALKQHQQTMYAYHHAMNIISHDASTAAPKKSTAGRGKAMEVLSGVTYGLIANPENGELLNFLEAHADELDAVTRRQAEVFRKGYDQLGRIPAEEYVAYSVLVNDAQAAWEEAKNADDFEIFAPYLEKIVDFSRKFAGYYDPEKLPYDALLNEFEEGMTMRLWTPSLLSCAAPSCPCCQRSRQPVRSTTASCSCPILWISRRSFLSI